MLMVLYFEAIGWVVTYDRSQPVTAVESCGCVLNINECITNAIATDIININLKKWDTTIMSGFDVCMCGTCLRISVYPFRSMARIKCRDCNCWMTVEWIEDSIQCILGICTCVVMNIDRFSDGLTRDKSDSNRFPVAWAQAPCAIQGARTVRVGQFWMLISLATKKDDNKTGFHFSSH